MSKKRILVIPIKIIKDIKKKIEKSSVEYGGWIEYEGVSDVPKLKKITKFKGEKLSVTVPTANYDLHWHTHPACLFNVCTPLFDKTGPIQPPSIDDIAQTSYKYYDVDFLMGEYLRQVVFTRHAIYIQSPISDVLDKFFKTKNILIHDKKTITIWTNKWYNPFKKEVEYYLRKIRSIGMDYNYIDDDTGKYVEASKEDKKDMIKKSLELEKKYFKVCEKYGVMVTKITNWKNVLKKGLEIRIK